MSAPSSAPTPVSMRAPRARFATAAAITAALSLTLLSGCPKDPYDPDTWIDQLGDRSKVERAITELSRLKDPKAIEPLGKTWRKLNRPSRILRVMIDIADQRDKGTLDKTDPKYEDTAKSKYGPFWKKGPFWEKAVPFLKEAAQEFVADELNQTAIDNGVIAVDALGRAKDPTAVEALIEVVNKQIPKKAPGQRVRLAAIRALGSFGSDIRAVKTLIKVLQRDPKKQRIELYAAAADALARTRNRQAVKPLIMAMFKMPPVYQFCRRALVAIGGPAEDELLKVFQGKSAEMNGWAKEARMTMECKKLMGFNSKCRGPKILQYKAASVLGDLNARTAIPALIKALSDKPIPAWFGKNGPGPVQHMAILDALRKMFSTKAAPKVTAMWKGKKAVDYLRPLSVDVYSFLARDTSEIPALAKIVCDRSKKKSSCANEAAVDQQFRLAAALAYARIANKKSQLGVLKFMIARYKKEADKAAIPAKKAKAAWDASKKAKSAARKKLAAVMKTTGGKKSPALDAAEKAMSAAEGTEGQKKQLHYQARGKALGMRGFERGFLQQLARAAVGVKCRGKGAGCYADVLDMKPAQVRDMLGKKQITDWKKWKSKERTSLQAAAAARAMLELAKLGKKAESVGPKLLKHAKTENRVVRQTVWLALVHTQTRPCKSCVDTLEQIIREQGDNTTLTALTADARVLKYYFMNK